MREDQAGDEVLNPADGCSSSEDNRQRWTYKCPRLNRRLQSGYRQFPVSPTCSEAGDLDQQVSSNDDQTGDDFLGQNQRSDLSPGLEIDVERAPALEEDETRVSEGQEPAQSQQDRATVQPDGSEYPGRQGLRAIFATESDGPEEIQEVPAVEDLRVCEAVQGSPEGDQSGLHGRQQGEIVWKSFPKPLRAK